MSAQTEQYLDIVFYLCRLATESYAHNVKGEKILDFTEQEVETLRKLTLGDARRLASQLGRHFLSSIKIDHEQLDRVLTRLEAIKEEEWMQNELVRLGAPSGMMAELFGMNGHEYAERRKSLKLTRVGRPSIPSESEQVRVYEMYKQYAGLEEPIKLLKIAQELGLNLTAVWPLVKSWGNISGAIARNKKSSRAPMEMYEHRVCA